MMLLCRALIKRCFAGALLTAVRVNFITGNSLYDGRLLRPLVIVRHRLV